MNKFLIGICAALLCACGNKREVADLIIHHAKIYCVDSAFTICEAMAINDGKITALGSNEDILGRYSSANTENLDGKTVFPGLIDAHCHFLAYGLGLGKVDLTGTKSFSEVIDRVIRSAEKNREPEQKQSTHPLPQSTNNNWIIGRGWDQNDWDEKNMPDRKILDVLFPERPIMLTRVDGHAVLVNGAALKLAGITAKTKIAGGEIVIRDNEATGLLIDNAVDLVKSKIPLTSSDEKAEALLNAQNACIEAGLTSVDDAGLMKEDIDLVDQLQKQGKLKIRMYAMLSDSGPNYRHYLKAGPYKTERLNVRSFKFYGDGALGSRGACLYGDYADKKGWRGFLLSSVGHFDQYADTMAKYGFQMNTHCIGDSAFGLLVKIYSRHCEGKGAQRWRIEHAQVTDPKDIKKLNQDIVPSVQPTHGTSDMYWAAERLGTDRVKNAYAYQSLKNASGKVALGTDFPVEEISPFKTFYAAVFRKDAQNFPAGGFQKENALSREETLKGMTIWAAWANFEEAEKGSLEKGKFADFVILDTDLMVCPEEQVLKTKVLATYINGEKVFGSGKSEH